MRWMCFAGDCIYFLINNRTLPVSEDKRIPGHSNWQHISVKSHLRFLILPPGFSSLIRNSAGMETKYSPFSVTSILRHDSFASNRGHFRSVRAHQAVSYPPATMSLAERLAGLISFLVLSSRNVFCVIFFDKEFKLEATGSLGCFVLCCWPVPC